MDIAVDVNASQFKIGDNVFGLELESDRTIGNSNCYT